MPPSTDAVHSPRLPRPRGFTLIEVVAALLIFTAGVLSVLHLGLTVQQRLGRLSSGAHASQVALERLDSLRTVPWAALTPGTTVDTVGLRADTCRVTVAVSQWSGRLRKVEVTAHPLSRPGSPATLLTYRLEAW